MTRSPRWRAARLRQALAVPARRAALPTAPADGTPRRRVVADAVVRHLHGAAGPREHRAGVQPGPTPAGSVRQ